MGLILSLIPRKFNINTGLDTILNPTLCIFREIAHYPGWYMNFGISHSLELPKVISLNLSGSIGYYNYDDDSFKEVDKDLNPTTSNYRSLHDGFISVNLEIPAGKNITISPEVGYSFPITDSADYFIKSSSFSNDSDFFLVGLTIFASFLIIRRRGSHVKT